MVELADRFPVYDFLVAYGRVSHWIPVHHPDATVYVSLPVEVHEGVYYGFAQVRVHGEPGPVPVA